MAENKLRVWPVIHLETTQLALENAAIASAAGAYGVFVIHMGGEDGLVVPAAVAIRKAYPSLKVGVNHLTKAPDESLHIANLAGLDAMWTDHPGVSGSGLSQAGMGLLKAHQGCTAVQVFASVAFKYQAFEKNPVAAILNAHRQGWLPTTSGPQTGQAPEAAWIKDLRNWIGSETPLAIASGMDAENVSVFAPLLSDMLVATGISESFHRFCPQKLQRFMTNAYPEPI